MINENDGPAKQEGGKGMLNSRNSEMISLSKSA